MNKYKRNANYKENWENLPWCFDEIPQRFSDSIKSIKNSQKSDLWKALDIWCWVWNYSNFLQKNWFDVLWIDFSLEALKMAKEKYWEHDKLKFIEADALKYDLWENQFWLICDISLFHHIFPNKRQTYISKIHKAVIKDWIFLLCCFNAEDERFNNKNIIENNETGTIMYPLQEGEIGWYFKNLFKYKVKKIWFWKNNRKRFLIIMKPIK